MTQKTQERIAGLRPTIYRKKAYALHEKLKSRWSTSFKPLTVTDAIGDRLKVSLHKMGSSYNQLLEQMEKDNLIIIVVTSRGYRYVYPKEALEITSREQLEKTANELMKQASKRGRNKNAKERKKQRLVRCGRCDGLRVAGSCKARRDARDTNLLARSSRLLRRSGILEENSSNGPVENTNT